MNAWVEAARPRTLTAGIAPVIVGTAAATGLIIWRAVAALIVSLSLQVTVNLANDLFDAQRAVDTEARMGPRRAVASGLIAPTAMWKAIVVMLILAGVAGIVLAAAAGWELLAIGALAVVATLAYSGGPRPYGSRALGEVMVFVFFGVVATAGSAYVQDEAFRALPLVASVPIGLLATAILMVNNLRDLATDRDAGKITVAVLLGPTRAAVGYRALIVAAFLSLPAIAAATSSAWPLLAAASGVLAVRPLRQVHASAEPSVLIAVLGATAWLELAFAVLLAAGLWIST